MSKEWFLRKKHLKKAGIMLAYEEQKDFILQAITVQDIEGIELAIKFNFNLDIKNSEGAPIWFEIAREAYIHTNSFASRVLILFSKSEVDIIYISYKGESLVTTALCSTNPYLRDFSVCNFTTTVAKYFHQRFLADLLNFKFYGDLEIFANLVVHINGDTNALKLAQLNGLKHEVITRISPELGELCKLNPEEKKINEEIQEQLIHVEAIISAMEENAININNFIMQYNKQNREIEEIEVQILKEINRQSIPDIEDIKELEEIIGSMVRAKFSFEPSPEMIDVNVHGLTGTADYD